MKNELIYATNIETIGATQTIGSGLIETRDLDTGHQLVRATFPSGEDWVPGCAEIVLAHVHSGRFMLIRDIGAGVSEAHWRPGQILLTPNQAPGVSRWPATLEHKCEYCRRSVLRHLNPPRPAAGCLLRRALMPALFPNPSLIPMLVNHARRP